MSTDINEMNRVIAEFDGAEKLGNRLFKNGKYINVRFLKYHSSWDWLMPVVEKIEAIYDDFHGYFGVFISSNGCTIQGTHLRTDPENPHYAYFNDHTHESKIAATHLCVYEFIQWYN